MNKTIAAVPVSNITGITDVEDGYLQGTVQILDCSFHAIFIRVTTRKGVQVAQGSDNAAALLADFQKLDEEPFRTVKVPGRPGKWVLVIQPYCD